MLKLPNYSYNPGEIVQYKNHKHLINRYLIKNEYLYYLTPTFMIIIQEISSINTIAWQAITKLIYFADIFRDDYI